MITSKSAARVGFYVTFAYICNISDGTQLMKMTFLNESQELEGISCLALLFNVQVWKNQLVPVCGIAFSVVNFVGTGQRGGPELLLCSPTFGSLLLDIFKYFHE